MVAQQKHPYISPEEYLERESKASSKSEYLDGIVVAMAGASPEHNAITFNLGTALGSQLRGLDCRGFGSDLRVRVPECNRYYYPDVTVVCGTPEYEILAGVSALLNPSMLIEVLSDSTEHSDRRDKFDCYGTLESLRAYVLILQDTPRIEVYTRLPAISWRYDVAKGLESSLPLDAIGCVLRLAEVYANVAFPAGSEEG